RLELALAHRVRTQQAHQHASPEVAERARPRLDVPAEAWPFGQETLRAARRGLPDAALAPKLLELGHALLEERRRLLDRLPRPHRLPAAPAARSRRLRVL